MWGGHVTLGGLECIKGYGVKVALCLALVWVGDFTVRNSVVCKVWEVLGGETKSRLCCCSM